MTEEASEEEAQNTTFETQYVTQGQANMAQWEARALADPSWLDPLSGNTSNTPACTTWNLVCTGDPFRYPDVSGPDGSAFYSNEATVTPVVFYDDGCARLSGRVWIPKTASMSAPAPEIVIDNGSIQAPETLYWPQAQALVRAGYAVLTFDPRGQGRSDEMTPTGGQGSNVNDSVFWTGLVNAIDFMHSSPTRPYPEQTQCAGTYPTVTANYNPAFAYVDNTRTGIAGHSAGAIGVSIVQGYGGPGAAPWPGKLDATNPVKVAVAWDGLRGPQGGDVGGIGSSNLPGPAYPAYAARVPSMGQSSEYGLAPVLFATPPPIQQHLDDYKAWVAANVPIYEMTYRGSTHYDFSLLENFPATSWCPDTSSGACTGGWADLASQYYTVAWFDRWLKNPGEPGYADADARLLNDFGVNGANKMSYHFSSARNFTDRAGVLHHCVNIRAGCGDATSPAIDALRRVPMKR
jgi:hypothetical protein